MDPFLGASRKIGAVRPRFGKTEYIIYGIGDEEDMKQNTGDETDGSDLRNVQA